MERNRNRRDLEAPGERELLFNWSLNVIFKFLRVIIADLRGLLFFTNRAEVSERLSHLPIATQPFSGTVRFPMCISGNASSFTCIMKPF